MRILTPGDLKSAPPSELHLVTGPIVQSETIRELWYGARAYSQRSDHRVNLRPPSGDCPILDAFSVAAELKGESVEESSVGKHHLREAQKWSVGGDQASPGGPAKRMEKLIGAA